MSKVARLRKVEDKPNTVMGEYIPPPARKHGLDDWIGPIIFLAILVLLFAGIKEIIDIARTAW